MLGKLKSNQGFTIIEVVIVLAIAGLIFAVVFIAVPQLQQGQRDSARESAMGQFEAAIVQYQARNNGNLPPQGNGGINTIRTSYMNNQFHDPVGGQYVYGVPSYQSAQIYYLTGRVCANATTTGVAGSGGPRNYTLVYQLEQGGNRCRDNR